MSVLADIEERLVETKNRISGLVQHLERLGSLEQSLDDAGRGVSEASTNIGNLAASTKIAMESLNGILVVLRQAVEVIQHSDPARTNEAIGKIGAQLEDIANQTAKIESGTTEFQKQFSITTSSIVSEIRNVQETISKQSKAINDIKFIGYATLSSMLALIGLTLYMFFSG